MNRRFLYVLTVVLVLGAACSTSTTVAQPTETAPTEEPEPTATPAPEPTAAPEPTEVPEATAVPVPETGSTDLNEAAERLAGEFDNELTGAEMACVFAALGDDEALAGSVLGSDFEDLPVDQQADLTIVMFECAPQATAASFSAALADDDGNGLPPEVGECLVTSMTTSPERRDIIIGFVALGDESAVPAPSQAPLVDTMVTCFPGAALLEAGAIDDPVFAQAVDMDCLATALDGEAMRPVWTALVTNPQADFDELDQASIEPMMNGMFSCMSFGRVIAAEAADDGVDLSDDTVACIDTELADLNFVEAMNDQAAQQQIGIAVLGCLTPEEAAQMGS